MSSPPPAETGRPEPRLVRALASLERLPAWFRHWARNLAVHFAVPFTGTAGLDIDVLDRDLVRVRVANRRRVRNHLGGVHATAAVLLAETASGLAVGMHLPDDCVPLLKTLGFRYTRRARGALSAEAALDAASIALLANETRGEVKVPVSVWDEDNEKPLECVLVWAWRPKGGK